VILVDTSIWVDHFRAHDAALAAALERGEVLSHPFVVGELACGTLRNRNRILGLLQALPSAPMASHAEALAFIEGRGLMGSGIGYVDVHLLAAVVLAADARLWTGDQRLLAIARDLNLAFTAT
jgi:predicted nucleic acid-binding protein